MALSCFDDRNRQPNPAELAAALGRSSRLWTDLVVWLDENLGPVTQTWQFTGAKWGWNLKVQRKKRAIVYLTPCSKKFLAGFVLGEKAVQAAFAAGLPDDVRQLVAEAPRYGEGRGVPVEVRFKRDVVAVKTLATAKMTT